METAARHSRFASLLMLGLLLCSPLAQPSAAALLFSPAENGCCGSCGHYVPPSPPAAAKNSDWPDHAGSAQTTHSEQPECDVCPSSVRCSPGASILPSHLHGLAPVIAQTAHFAPRADDPVTPLHDGGLFRPPRPDAACTGQRLQTRLTRQHSP
ncbi:MAG: hypothetical protein LBB66_09580 [Desulfovibrio sp.]|nr:hypothetical protein [Desulfovibrio sp.]